MKVLLLVATLLLTSAAPSTSPPAGPSTGASAGAPADCLNAGGDLAGRLNTDDFDFDGDGYDDAVVGDPVAPGDDWTGSGRLFLLGGTADGLLHPKIAEFSQASTPESGGGSAGDSASAGESRSGAQPSGQALGQASGPEAGQQGGLPGWTAQAGHIDGDRCLDLVIGNPFAYGSTGSAGSATDSTAVPGAGVAYIYWGGPGFPRTTRLELKAPAPRHGAHFGWSIAVADGTVAIGAPHEDADEIPDSGAVYVFHFNGRTPGPAQRITQNSPGVPGNGEEGDAFGWSVALGRLGGLKDPIDLAVGAPFEDREEIGQTDTGAVTAIYDVTTRPWAFRGTGWDLPMVTQEVPSRAGDRLGYSLAYGRNANRGYLAAGAPTADPAGIPDAGVVVLLETTDWGDPRLLRLLRQGTADVGDTPDERDRFGFSLAFGGSSMIVGVPGESDPSAPESGAVQVVRLAEAGAGRTIRASDATAYDRLGWSLAPAGNGWFVAGAPDHGTTGALMVFSSISGDSRLLTPGTDGFLPTPGSLTDFGATLAG